MTDGFKVLWDNEFNKASVSKNWLTESLNTLSASFNTLSASFTAVSASVTALKLDEKGISVLGQQVKKWPWTVRMEAEQNHHTALIKSLTAWSASKEGELGALEKARTEYGSEMTRLRTTIADNQRVIKEVAKEARGYRDAAGRAANDTEAAEYEEKAKVAEARIRVLQEEVERSEGKIRGLEKSAARNLRDMDKIIAEGNKKYFKALDQKENLARLKADSEKSIEDLSKRFQVLESRVQGATRVIGP